jgi:hypothetical protein
VLTKLDETLHHQIPTTFDHVYTSDHRFYDRYWVGLYPRGGRLALMSGIATYSNTNVMDGFAVVLHDDHQDNLRVSRALRPEIDQMRIGPIEYEIVEPLKTLRIRVGAGDHSFRWDLEWEGILPPHEEDHHFGRAYGRVVQDYRRYDQVGRVRGWLEIEGERIEADNWFGVRDHSWGVRPGMGGWEPATGPADARMAAGFLFLWLNFATDDGKLAGYFQTVEDGAGNRASLDGWMRFPGSDRPDARVTDLEHELEFYDGTRTARRGRVFVTTEDGEKWEIEAETVTVPFAYIGSGYDNGFNDGRGLGHYRGEYYQEVDRYDVSHPADVVFPDGSIRRPGHREAIFRLVVNGASGMGHFPIMSGGPHQRYGFRNET